MEHGARLSPSFLERGAFVAFALVGVGLTHVAGAQQSDTGSSLAEAIWATAYVLALVALIVRRRLSTMLIARSVPLLLAIGVALASTLWSFDHLLTLRRSMGLVGTTIVALYVVVRYPLATFMKTLIATIDVAAIVSAVLVAFNPGLGVMQGAYQGAWCGLFIEKNHLGAAMSLGILTMVVMLPASSPKLRSFLFGSIALCATLLLGSRSVTSIVALGVALMLRFLLLRFGLSLRAIVRAAIVAGIGATAVACAAYICDFTIADALGLLGRDTTFTGRDAVWQLALGYFGQRLPFGYGYQVFWESTSPAAAAFTSDLGWDPSTAHNGFLQVGLDLGLAGLCALCSFLGTGLVRSAALLVRRAGPTAAWPFLVLTSMIVSNLAEATFLLYNDLLWLTVIIAFYYATLESGFARSPLPTVPQRLALRVA